MTLYNWIKETARKDMGLLGALCITASLQLSSRVRTPDCAPLLILADYCFENGLDRQGQMLKRVSELAGEMNKLWFDGDAIQELMEGLPWGPDAMYLFEENRKLHQKREPYFEIYLTVLYRTEI